ncbi:MAG: helix-hairpin-helix domain-containing protein [Saprospiraceae bacterium]|nr:helix-hairpin-helix domain-containing protein [Saprospiraceae bacterium]
MRLKGFKTYLRFSNRERKSFYYLTLVLAMLVIVYFVTHFRTVNTNYLLTPLTLDNDTSNRMVDSFLTSVRPRLKRFNPNTADLSQLMESGVPVKAARNWVKYLQKGGRFRDIQGISRIYGMTPEWVNLLTPYLEFETNPKTTIPIIKSKSETPEKKSETFDPNSAAIAQFINGGLPYPIARVILNYRTKGGVFKKPEDLLKIYGMNDSLFTLISPHLSFPIAYDHFQSPEKENPDLNQLTVDINLTDTAGWKRLPGIGTLLAKRIIGFREILGGFISVDQLSEVYGLRDSTLHHIRPFLLSSPVFRKIRINYDLPLSRPHPYLSVKDSKVIANFIIQNGPIKSHDQLGLILAFDRKFWDRLLPYLSFDVEQVR